MCGYRAYVGFFRDKPVSFSVADHYFQCVIHYTMLYSTGASVRNPLHYALLYWGTTYHFFAMPCWSLLASRGL